MYPSNTSRFVNLLGLLSLLYAGGIAAQWGWYPPPRHYGPPWAPQQPYPGAASQEAVPTGGQQPSNAPSAEEDYIRDASGIVGEADWGKQRTVTVQLSEYRYFPENLRLQAGVPYKMELVNRGRTKHYFTAPGFFRAIATRKVQSNHDGEIKAPYFTALELMPNGGQLDLYFVPVRTGSYRVECTIPGHAEQGMVGTLIIE